MHDRVDSGPKRKDLFGPLSDSVHDRGTKSQLGNESDIGGGEPLGRLTRDYRLITVT